MKRFIFAIVIVLSAFLSSATAQQITIKPEHHVENIGPIGFCGPCCLETIALHHGFTDVSGFTTRLHKRFGDYGGAMFDRELCLHIQAQKISYYWIPRNIYSYAWLEYACTHKYPCIVELRPAAGQTRGHYIVLTGFYADRIHYFDCNGPGRDHTMTRQAFAAAWYGNMIVMYNERTK